VWLSNQYANTGIDFTRLSITYRATNTVTFVPDPNNQPKNVGGAATNEIDLIDPDYKYPSIIRTNLAYDRALGIWGLVGTAEVLFSKTLEDVKYNNLNLVQTGTRPDGRPLYSRLYPTLSNTLLLTNTTEGSNYSITGKVDRPFSNGWFASGSYLYGDANTIQDGTNSTAFSTWANVYTINTSDPPLTRSNFSVGHRITMSGSKTVGFGKGIAGTFSLYYNGQSGRPYVILFNGDANLDNRSNNDIAFIPASADQVILQNGSWDQLNAFISSDPASKDNRGTIPARNSGRAPWSNSLDFRYGVNVPTGGKTKVAFAWLRIGKIHPPG